MIAVAATDIVLCEKARALAAYLHVNFIGLLTDENEKAHSNLLLLTPSYLGIYKARNKKIKPFYIDFLSGKMRYRIQHASLRRELLARAVGLRNRRGPSTACPA